MTNKTGHALLLTLLIALAFSPALNAGFVYDDMQYILANPHVLRGLHADGFRWAFTTFYASNWHPLTWISHMVDVSVFGPNPAGHHAASIFLHAAATLLLYRLLASLTGRTRASLLASVLFAIHPLRVESVVWIAERKDVLATLFFVATVSVFVQYVRKPAVSRYFLTCLLFSVGLMAKPMLVTLPFVLLLLDYWPLDRYAAGQGSPLRRLLALVREKVPLFCLAAASTAITLLVQKDLGATIPVKDAPFALRVFNALWSYAAYLEKTVWPAGLSPIYPFPDQGVPASRILLSTVLLTAITVAALRWLRRRPYVAVCWFWYLGMLVPVIGLVQVGEQAMADRYTYLPSIGLVVAVAWGSEELFRKKPGARPLTWTAWAIVTVMLVASTRMQSAHWRDNRRLFEHAVAVTTRNYVALTALGSELAQAGDLATAERLLRQSLATHQGYVWTHYNLGVLLQQKGAREDAIRHYREAVRLAPRFAQGHAVLGAQLAESGRLDEALLHLREAVRLSPEAFVAWENLGKLLWRMGSREDAMAAVRKAVEVNPDYENGKRVLEKMMLLRTQPTR